MNPARLIALASLYLILIPSLAGQDETQPLSPLLNNVTVDPQSGFATVSWLLSASPDVGSYVVYTYEGGRADAVDTIRSPVATFYVHTASQARYRSVTYVVAAIDSSLNVSPLSNSLSTVFLSAGNDTCNNRIVLSWTPYNNTDHPADNYEIRVASGSGSAMLHGTVPSTQTSYIYSGFDPGTAYCIHITATNDGSPLSSSNNACVTTGYERAPSWIQVDAIAVAGQALQVPGSYDGAATADDFLLQRYNPVISSWETAAGATGVGGAVSFTVTGADTTVASLFRISLLNNCSVTVATSGNVRNMVLESSVSGTRIDLRWNNPFPDGDAIFDVMRETGQGWEAVVHGLSDTLWSEDYSLFTGGLTTAIIAYQVTATAPDPPFGAPLYRSSVSQIQPDENIFFPNAIIPDATGENALFKPEFSFIPTAYDLRVYSRNGVLLFQTGDHAAGWDGRHKGEALPTGVYLWSLKLTTQSGKPLVRNGTVTLLP